MLALQSIWSVPPSAETPGEDAAGVGIGEDLRLEPGVGAGLEPLADRSGGRADVDPQRELVFPLEEPVQSLLRLEDQDQVRGLGTGLGTEAAAHQVDEDGIAPGAVRLPHRPARRGRTGRRR